MSDKLEMSDKIKKGIGPKGGVLTFKNYLNYFKQTLAKTSLSNRSTNHS